MQQQDLLHMAAAGKLSEKMVRREMKRHYDGAMVRLYGERIKLTDRPEAEKRMVYPKLGRKEA